MSAAPPELEPAPAPNAGEAAPPRASAVKRLAGGVARAIAGTGKVVVSPFADPTQRLIVITITISSISLILLTWYVGYQRLNPVINVTPPPATLADALAAFDAGRHTQARELLAEAEANETLREGEFGGPDFLRGALLADAADRMWDLDQARFSRQAARYLLAAQKQGWPPGREAQGPALLCASLINSGQGVLARPFLAKTIADNPRRAAELHRLATLAYLQDPEPDLPRALEHSAAYLAAPELEISARQNGLWQRAQILFRQGDDAACHELLNKIQSNTDAALDALLLQAELAMRVAQRAADQAADPSTAAKAAEPFYRKTLRILGQAQMRGQARERILRRACYLSGICLRELGETRKAWEQFQKTRTQYPRSPEGITAAVEEALLADELGLDEEVVPTLLVALQEAGNADDYHNPLLPLDELRARMTAIYRAFMKAELYESAANLATAFAGIFPPETAADLTAQARVTWARKLQDEAETQIMPLAEETFDQARKQFRLAGEEYGKLAKRQYASLQYTEEVWKSAENLLLGKDYRQAAEMFSEYLRYELKQRRPLALLRLGECQLLQGEPDAALMMLQECIESFPRDAASYRARLLAAKANLDKGNRDAAKVFYLANLESGQLTPASTEWRDALFALGTALFGEAQVLESAGRGQDVAAITLSAQQILAQQRYEESIQRLEEAVERYPQSPQVVPSRYLIGEAYRALSVYPRARLASATIRTTRDEYAKELRRLLNSAIDQYHKVQEALANRRENQPLNALEHTLLRNCYFALGAALFELERFDEAISIYTALINRYQGEPEVLDAYLQLTQCQRKLNRLEDAKNSLEQARITLNRLTRNDNEFMATTNHTRSEWERIFDWLGRL